MSIIPFVTQRTFVSLRIYCNINYIQKVRTFSSRKLKNKIVARTGSCSAQQKNNFSRASFAKKVAPSLTFDATSFDAVDHDTRINDLNIGIVGGGISGLYAALLLKDIQFPANIDVLEANPDRLGGRIFTKYFDEQRNGNAITNCKSGIGDEDYRYFDVGAMRFPKMPIHDRIVGDQPWSLVNYLNKHAKAGANSNCSLPINLIPYKYESRFMYFNGIKRKANELNVPDPFNFKKKMDGLALPEGCNKNGDTLCVDTLRVRAMEHLKAFLMKDQNTAFDALMKVDEMSVRDYMHEFLLENSNSIHMLSQSNDLHGDIGKIIDTMEKMDPWTGSYSLASITETIIDQYEFSDKETFDWVCIDNGSHRIIDAMEKSLGRDTIATVNILKGARVTMMNHCHVTNKIEVTVDDHFRGMEEQKMYNHVISTVPFSVLKSIDTSGLDLSKGKLEAFDALKSDHSCKIAILFENRWWQDEDIEDEPISGGQSYSDLPSQTIVYPSYGDKHSPGVLITSYTWGTEADRMSKLSHEERVEVSLCDLEKIHGPMVRNQNIIDSFSHSWTEDPFVKGAFICFGPGQFSSYLDDCIKIEVGGRLHFAGEASSINPAWVVGSLNSAYRTVVEILGSRPHTERIHFTKKLMERWGTVDELDIK